MTRMSQSRTFLSYTSVLAALLAISFAGCGGPPPPSSPAIGVSPISLVFTATPTGASPAAQSIQVSNTGVGTLEWTCSSSAGWLLLAPLTGTTTTETDEVSVSVDTTGLTVAGSPYMGQITISAPRALETRIIASAAMGVSARGAQA